MPHQACCGFPLQHWAMGACIANGLFFLILSFLAFLAHHWVSAQETDTTAEGSDASVWANPKVISITLGVFFLLLGLASFLLFYLVGFKASSSPKALLRTWLVTTAFAVFVTAWSVAGDVMSFSSAMEGIKAACSEVDTECSSNYTAIAWTSIPLEIVGLLTLVWMLASSWNYRRALRSSSMSSSRPPPDPADQDEEALLNGPPASALHEKEADATRSKSLGRRRSKKGERSGYYYDDLGTTARDHKPRSSSTSKSRKSSARLASEHSVSKSRVGHDSSRYSSKGAASTRKDRSLSAYERRAEEEVKRIELRAKDWVEKDLDSMRRSSRSRKEDRRGRSGSRTRSKRPDSSEEEEYAMSKRSARSRSASRRRTSTSMRGRGSTSTSEESERSSSSDGGRGRKRSASRRRSRY